MKDSQLEAAMPEMVVYLKALILGFVISEIFRIALQLGRPLANQLGQFSDALSWCLIVIFIALVTVYAVCRGAKATFNRLSKSRRLDLLLTVGIGVVSDQYLVPPKVDSHLEAFFNSQAFGWGWAAATLLFFALLMVSSLVSFFRSNRRVADSQIYFLTDREIDNPDQDCLSLGEDARTFAETVLASNTASGLVFGLEGPWGIGKTSFLKMVEAYWATEAPSSIILFRFEPLRYAGEADLTERFVKELLSVVQCSVFAPEFKVALSRYSKMLKGKAEFSLFGLKLSFEPSNETVDELLRDLDSVLRRANRRLIVIVEDLDRIEPKAVSNVLFTVRRTFNLSQATYILCYDTENLIAEKDEGRVSREFLEKFINVKFSVLIDSAAVIKYLNEGWQREREFMASLTSDRKPVLTELLSDLASLLAGKNAVQYMQIVGNIRKVKRFINAVVAIRLETLDISITDFDRGDIINLVLLHMNYPGVFRQIYSEEMEGRSGIFSTLVNSDKTVNNHLDYLDYVSSQEPGAKFLLDSLFSMSTRKSNEGYGRARAFVNDRYDRSLEKYLQLIIKCTVPDPAKTHKLFQCAVSKATQGDSIQDILEGRGFELSQGEHAHQKFWELFVDKCSNDVKLAFAAADALVDIAPRYMLLRVSGENLRHRSMLHIVRLLDAVGWNSSKGKNVWVEPDIANKIFGEEAFVGSGMLERMLASEPSVLKWHDVLLFRQYCSPEKNGRYQDVYKSLRGHLGSQSVSSIQADLDPVRECVRYFSQYVFARFRSEFIDPQKNFFELVWQVPTRCFWGEVDPADASTVSEGATLSLDDRVNAERNYLISFVVYNLINVSPVDGQVGGCGVFDLKGNSDKHQISELMNEYLFGFCFDVERHENNLMHFLDFCIYNFPHKAVTSEGSESLGSDSDFNPVANEVILSLDLSRLTSYWRQHRDRVLNEGYLERERSVCTHDYVKKYSESLKAVLKALDAFCDNDVTASSSS